jgi:hypothetical protein
MADNIGAIIGIILIGALILPIPVAIWAVLKG